MLEVVFEIELLFELLHGYPPFDDASPMGVYQKIMAGKVRPRATELHPRPARPPPRCVC